MTKDMAETEEESLRRAIGRREQQLETALKDLVHVAEERASLAHYFERYPWQFVGGAFMLGFILGSRR
jgi:ElaB/YqjD/DUF883 family membrane-anchored ribosome-binding protein